MPLKRQNPHILCGICSLKFSSLCPIMGELIAKKKYK